MGNYFLHLLLFVSFFKGLILIFLTVLSELVILYLTIIATLYIKWFISVQFNSIVLYLFSVLLSSGISIYSFLPVSAAFIFQIFVRESLQTTLL
jgi:hypothetical protein